DAVEFILLGTGTSGTLPHVDCLTAPPGTKRCRACTASLSPGEGRKNKRANTSAIARVRGRDGQLKTIVIDVGKSFLQSAVEWFPKYGLRRIDAVLITHAHADAMNGLDDLRGWTLRGAIQSHVDIYCSEETFEAVKVTFPYLVRKEFASGGGDVPEFRWHPWLEDRHTFEILDTGIKVTPLAVKHGFCGAKVVPKPEKTMGYMETTSPIGSGLPGTPVGTGTPKQEDFICLGFVIQDSVVYISDVSEIPEDVMSYLENCDWPRPPNQPARGPPVLVLDCLSLDGHRSHLSLAQSVDYLRKLNAQKTYLVGFTHSTAHDEYETLLRAVSGRLPLAHEMTDQVVHGLKTLDLKQKRPIWARPAFDGLRIFVSNIGAATDEGYLRDD
ncbi:beta-lactamase-like protein, partial [Epithele typhae]|uniref:beta-lactamase-like protein n=1 Tax=Epithele typhae TaxID=378194 RepID=UPI002007B73B